MQPFNSIYNKSILPNIECDLNQNKTSLYKLVNKINTLYIPEETIAEFDEGKDMFINLNTVKEVEEYTKKIRRRVNENYQEPKNNENNR